MEKIKIGIDANGLYKWGGGVDFIATIAEALEYTGTIQTYLIIGKDSMLAMMMKNVKWLLKSKFRMSKYKNMKRNYKLEVDFTPVLNGFAYCSPNTIPILYKKTESRFINNSSRMLEKCLKKNSIQIILPSLKCVKYKKNIPQIGYIPDFQHKYLKEYFSAHECKMRDKDFKNQLDNSKYMLVNANTVKNDILKYYPEYGGQIITLPFKPFQKPKIDGEINLKRYKLPKKYYIIANQFWMHKSHITAFNALEELYEKGYEDLHIVCTGKLKDYRNEGYIDELKEKIDRLKCKNNIHLLGFIPKSDQIEIMKNARGLIQPTLFEGTPGGLAVYNALCLGITCLVSDIPVNKEIVGYANVYFFNAKNAHDLAALMVSHIDDIRIADNIVNKKRINNKKEYGEYLSDKIKGIIETEKESECAFGKKRGY